MTPTSPNQLSINPVASEEATMVATLLPIRSAPIIRSRSSSSRLTMAALGSPSRASRAMVARDEAVSAVSLPEKKNDTKRQNATAIRATKAAERKGAPAGGPPWGGLPRGDLAGKKGAPRPRLDVGRHEGRPDGAHENEC